MRVWAGKTCLDFSYCLISLCVDFGLFDFTVFGFGHVFVIWGIMDSYIFGDCLMSLCF